MWVILDIAVSTGAYMLLYCIRLQRRGFATTVRREIIMWVLLVYLCSYGFGPGRELQWQLYGFMKQLVWHLPCALETKDPAMCPQ